MDTQRLHYWLYVANATVLIIHQIDAAFWHEWRLFGLPGGIQLFLLLNLPIVLVVLIGAARADGPDRAGRVISWLLVGSGLFAVVFHAVHLLQGDGAFKLPVSLALLATAGVLSAAQAACLVRLGSGAVPAAAPAGPVGKTRDRA